MDTNGVVDTFYFGSNATFTAATKSKADSSLLNVDGSRINKGVDRYIWIKDDDGLLRGNSNKDSLGNPKKFVVFADSVPLKPTVFTAGINNDSVTIYWKNKDFKDGEQTQYKIILAKDNSLPGDNEILIDFKDGYEAANFGSYQYKYKFRLPQPAGSGDYYYRVIARDARLSTSRSDVDNFPY